LQTGHQAGAATRKETVIANRPQAGAATRKETVIANQPTGWCGNPLSGTKECRNELKNGFPRQCAHWLGMTNTHHAPPTGLPLKKGELA
jgi:hypothetical protein